MALELYGKNIICTRENGTVAFELADSELFYMTGFKVIQNFPGGGLLSAYRTRLNGRIRLVFDVDELVSVTSLIDKMTPDQFCMMMLSLVSLCERINSNGFIHGENVCLEEDMIFVDRSTWQARLIYVPLKPGVDLTVQQDSFDTHLVELLWRMMTMHSTVMDSRSRQVLNLLGTGNRDISQIKDILVSAGVKQAAGDGDIRNEYGAQGSPDSLILERIGGSQSLLLHIPANGAVIGKDDTYSQILIPDPSVSKKHCHIRKEGSVWLLEDLQSTNHTWVGEGSAPMAPFTPREIRPGDRVKIARFTFMVKAGIGD